MHHPNAPFSSLFSSSTTPISTLRMDDGTLIRFEFRTPSILINSKNSNENDALDYLRVCFAHHDGCLAAANNERPTEHGSLRYCFRRAQRQHKPCPLYCASQQRNVCGSNNYGLGAKFHQSRLPCLYGRYGHFRPQRTFTRYQLHLHLRRRSWCKRRNQRHHMQCSTRQPRASGFLLWMPTSIS